MKADVSSKLCGIFNSDHTKFCLNVEDYTFLLLKVVWIVYLGESAGDKASPSPVPPTTRGYYFVELSSLLHEHGS